MTDIFSTTETVDALTTLVGDGKKFKDVEALAKGKIESDLFIESLKREAEGLRAQLDPQFDAKAELARLREEFAAARVNPSSPAVKPVTPDLTVDGIAAIVNETITRADRDRTAQQNVSLANEAVVKHFGTPEAAAQAVQTKAAELNLPLAELRAIAEKSPSAFQKIILGDAPVGGTNTPLNPTTAPTNHSSLMAPATGSNAYFDAILVADKKRYWSPEVQMALHKAVKDGTYQL